MTFGGYPGGIGIKNPHANAGNVTDVNSIPVSRRLPKVGNGSHSNILLGKLHRWRNLVGCSPQGGRESDMTAHAHIYMC